MNLKRKLILILLTVTVSVFCNADTYTNWIKIITQDCDLSDGALVYILSIEKEGYDYPLNRFAIMNKKSWSHCTFSYKTPSGADVIHVPMHVLDIADEVTNLKFEIDYHFYKPQVWMIGVLDE